MRFYRLKDREAQEQFMMLWAPGKLNLADYYTKHHAPAHHQSVERFYLHDNQKSPTHLPKELSTSLQGCAKTT
jgi:predicted transposase YdaD